MQSLHSPDFGRAQCDSKALQRAMVDERLPRRQGYSGGACNAPILRERRGARYGVVLTGSHRSLRTRWHTLCEGRPKRKLSRVASAEARGRVSVCETKGKT